MKAEWTRNTKMDAEQEWAIRLISETPDEQSALAAIHARLLDGIGTGTTIYSWGETAIPVEGTLFSEHAKIGGNVIYGITADPDGRVGSPLSDGREAVVEVRLYEVKR